VRVRAYRPTRRRALKFSRLRPCIALRRYHGPANDRLEHPPCCRTGYKLPVVGVGTWQTFDVGRDAAERTELKDVLRLLVQHGGAVVDSSPMYGRAEGVVGDLAQELKLNASLFLATKVWTRGEAAGIAQMQDSFRLLRTQRIDLMQVHNLVDWKTHLKTLKAWKSSGRLRSIGITHYHAGAYEELMTVMRTPRVRLRAVELLHGGTRSRAAPAAPVRRAGHGRHHQPSLLARRLVSARQRQDAARMG